MKISFDFDGCLGDNKYIQMLALSMVKHGMDVYVLTARFNDKNNQNRDLWSLVETLGIKEENCLFAGETQKQLLMKEHNIDLHFDDNELEVSSINQYFDSWDSPNSRAVLVGFDLQNVLNIYSHDY